MYHHIAVPVDLTHTDELTGALRTAADLAGLYRAKLTLVGVTGPAPSEVAHNPSEFKTKLEQLAERLQAQVGQSVNVHVVLTADPTVDLEKALNSAFHELGADLAVMATHVPTFSDYVFRSHGNYLATHTDLSVLLVRH